jgi:cobalt transporter subunit CbtB
MKSMGVTEVVMLADKTMNEGTAIAVVPNRWVAAFFAAILGGFLLFGAGFAQSQLLHNAAHDSRHASGFPCH